MTARHPENVFFLYQQSIEKVLKAVLCRLNEFAGVRRYEEGAIRYEREDLEEARVLTEELIAWGRRFMEPQDRA